MANPTLTPFPTPPLPEQDEVTFNRNAANSLLAQANFVTEGNIVITWMGQQIDAAAASKKAAADSATAAGQSVTDAAAQVKLASDQASNAKTYADNAKTYRDSAQAIAAGYGNQSGLPALIGHAGDFLGVLPDEKTVGFFPGIQIGFQEFTSTGSFAKPEKAKWFYVEVVGAGSSGALIAVGGSNTRYAQGGIGGDYNWKLLRASDLDATTAVVVGVGGAAVSRTASTTETRVNGTPGGDTSFGSLVKAAGGKSPIADNAQQTVVRDGDLRGGISGTALVASTMASLYTGSSIKGGGPGASSVLSSGAVVNGAPGGSQDAGSGGQPGQPGVFPGGGGGALASIATSGTVSSGAGAGGRVRIYWW